MRGWRSVSLWVVAGSIVGTAGIAWSADTELEAGMSTGLEVCGHLGEVAAAREALQAGERQRALDHLKAARQILVECEARVDLERDERVGVELI